MVTPGYFTIVLLQMFFNGIILLAIGVVAQYVGNIHENSSSKPPFIISQRINALSCEAEDDSNMTERAVKTSH